MKKLLKKRQLIMATLVLALGAAVFINWYYTKPNVQADASVKKTTSVNKAEDADDAHLGDSLYVHNPYSSKSSEYFAGAKLKRSAAHDEAKETLNAVITGGKADSKAVSDATAALEQLAKNIKQESDCESLITAKTGGECLVMISDAAVEVVLGTTGIDSATALQIKEILIKQTGFGADAITIVELG
ncbi:MAG: SpoIIIAH-like family protein [Oscillospiraceae bacterium]|nr:SpoIIIAH-like family protein [Oscillospiraceae bacterium]